MPTLSDLTSKYFAASGTYEFDSEARFLIDGEDYFEQIYQAMQACNKPGDIIYLMGWYMETCLRMRIIGGEHNKEIPDNPMLCDLLLAKQQLGVDVRVLVWGSSHARLNRNEVAANRAYISLLRDMGITQSAVDCTGDLTGSHHAKGALIGNINGLKAFLGGLDFAENRIDSQEHRIIRFDASSFQPLGKEALHPFIWHDAGMMVQGKIAAEVLRYFISRWNTCHAQKNESAYLGPTGLPDAYMVKNDIPETPRPGADQNAQRTKPAGYSWYSYLPASLNPIGDMLYHQYLANPSTIPNTSGTALQFLRSVSSVKVDEWRTMSTVMLRPAENEEHYLEIAETLEKAIGAAKRYIYIEDQYLNQNYGINDRKIKNICHDILFPSLVKALMEGVKVIFLTSGYGDPADKSQGPVNTSVGDEIQSQIIDKLTDMFGNPKVDDNNKPYLDNFVFYRLNYLLVHSKVTLIDDEFICVGSNNTFDRSMTGLDSEIAIAAVSDGSSGPGTYSDFVRDARIRLWSEHLGVPLINPEGHPIVGVSGAHQAASRSQLESLDQALGMWHSKWRTDPTFRFVSDLPGALTKPPGPRLQIVYPATY